MKNGIRLAVRQDIPTLCEIWKSCFSDSEEYINYFYNENFKRIKVLVYDVDSTPVSAVNLLDSEFINNNECHKVKYLYAGGTLPEYRKSGYFSLLLKYAFEMAKQYGYGLFLKPSTEALVSYFAAQGFKTDSSFHLVTVYPDEIQPISLSDISYKVYNSMRNDAYSNIPYARWNDEHVCWCVKENEYFSGRTLKITLNKKDYLLMCYPEDNTLVITETNLSVSQIKQISGALCDLFATEMIKAYMPDFSCNNGERIISSMVYNTSVSNTYVNLILI